MTDSLINELKELLVDSMDMPPAITDNEKHIQYSHSLEEMQLNERVNGNQGYRVYSDYESNKLDTNCRDYIAYLEKLGLIDFMAREELINQLMLSDSNKISLDELKWTLIEIMDESLSSDQLNFLDFVLFTNGTVAH